jgi:hypothetical protein
MVMPTTRLKSSTIRRLRNADLNGFKILHLTSEIVIFSSDSRSQNFRPGFRGHERGRKLHPEVRLVGEDPTARLQLRRRRRIQHPRQQVRARSPLGIQGKGNNDVTNWTLAKCFTIISEIIDLDSVGIRSLFNVSKNFLL